MRLLLGIALAALLAGCASPAALHTASVPVAAPDASPHRVEEENQTEMVFIGFPTCVPGQACGGGIEAHSLHVRTTANGSSATMMLYWNATQPAAARLQLHVHPTTADSGFGPDVASGAGPSPLRVALPAEQLAQDHQWTLEIDPDAGGLSVQQPIHVVVDESFG